MTIAFLLQDTGVLYGAERATLALIRGLRDAGFFVLVLLIRETRLGIRHSRLEEACYACGIKTVLIVSAGRVSLTVVRQVRHAFEESKADVLHTVGYKADIHGGVASGWGRLFPVVSTVHGWLFRPNLKELVYQWLNLFALRHFTQVVVLSQWYEHYVESRGVRKTVLIRPGLRVDCIPSEPESSTVLDEGSMPFSFGMLGRLSEEKNHAFFLSAACTVATNPEMSNVRFLVAGEGPLRSALEHQTVKMGLANIVEFAGYLSSHEFFRRIHVLVQCSIMDNQPVSMLEAMAWKKPIVATDVGGLPEMLVDQESGYLIRHGDTTTLAARMVEMVCDRRICAKMGMAGRRLLEERFSWERMMNQYMGLYQAIARRRAGSGSA